MWCVPHPCKPDCTLVLLDTEGLGDVEKGDPKNDSWIFALAVLLCSSFVYNSMSTINHQALEQLHSIHAVANGLNPKAQISNLPRECIRHFFPRRKCFVFDRPINNKELLAHIEKVVDNQLDPNFKEQTKNFCSYILTQARTKTLREGITVTGKRLRTLVVTYVDAINSGAVPCLENAVTTLAQLENSGAVQKAANHYSEQMAQRVSFPTDTLQELLDLHAACEKEAIAIFMEHSFKDDNHGFQKNLVEIIKDKQDKILLQNEEASVKFCQEKLEQLSKSLMEGISAGIFSVPGGHKLYMETKERLEQDYWKVPRKGVKAHEVLQRFLQSQAATENSILQADKALTDGEKAMAAERAKKEAAEKEQELMKQKLQEQQQQMEAQKRSLEENILQLKEKMERDRETIIREQNMILEHKLKVQEDLLREGFKKKSEEMNAEINHLRNMIDTAQNDNTSWIEKAIDVFSILVGPGKLFRIVQGIGSLFKWK